MNVLITGTSSGFGRVATEVLASKGHTVLATMRGVDGKNADAAASITQWATDAGVTVHVVELDVTSDDSVTTAVASAIDIAGHLDVVINNAGAGTMGHAETYTVEQAQHIFNVNLFGVHRVTRAVLPHMRARKAGLVIQISSTLGRFVLPLLGIYGASKYALEALSEAYRYELTGTGVDIAIVEPGAFPTEFGANITRGEDSERAAGYAETANLADEMTESFRSMFDVSDPPNPTDVADALAALIDMPAGERPLRTVVDSLSGEGIRSINRFCSSVQAQAMYGMGFGDLLAD